MKCIKPGCDKDTVEGAYCQEHLPDPKSMKRGEELKQKREKVDRKSQQ